MIQLSLLRVRAFALALRCDVAPAESKHAGVKLADGGLSPICRPYEFPPVPAPRQPFVSELSTRLRTSLLGSKTPVLVGPREAPPLNTLTRRVINAVLGLLQPARGWFGGCLGSVP